MVLILGKQLVKVTLLIMLWVYFVTCLGEKNNLLCHLSFLLFFFFNAGCTECMKITLQFFEVRTVIVFSVFPVQNRF